MNKIILSGNLCKDIEVKYYNDRKNIKNTIAVRRDFKNKNGEYDTDFFTFTIWGNQAEYIDKFANKGDKVLICGKLLNNNYEKDGNMVYSNDIQVENIELIGNRKSTNEIEKDFGDIVEIASEEKAEDLLD
jgi:single-strand DNA-binding protein